MDNPTPHHLPRSRAEYAGADVPACRSHDLARVGTECADATLAPCRPQDSPTRVESPDSDVTFRPQDSPTRVERADAARREHARRHSIAERLAADHDGVVTRTMLVDAGLYRTQIRSEVERGVWRIAGWHTLSILGPVPTGRGLWWRALWESGSRSVLDGVTALQVAGLTGWREDVIHVGVPIDAKLRPIDGVRHHRLRAVGDVIEVGLRRTRPEVATIRAAQWARTDRQASTLVAMAVQQRLVRPADVLARWDQVRYSPRRGLLAGVIADVCDGAHSMSELDFARLCREWGLPEPTRQAIRSGPRGRVYLDVFWEHLGVHVEIQGVQHQQGEAVVEDALRFNELALGEPMTSLQVPVLGLRVRPDEFMRQVERALRRAKARRAA